MAASASSVVIWANQPVGLGEAEHIVDVVVLAPVHQCFPAEPAVGAHDNRRFGPALPDLRDNARQLLDDARGSVDVGRPELCRQQMTTTEYVQRQITIGVVKPVIEAAFLLAVQGHVGGIGIEHDQAWRARLRFQEHVDEQSLDGVAIVTELVIARRRMGGALFGRVLKPIERAFTGECRAILAARLHLAHQRRQNGIVSQVVVIIDVLVAERQTEYALAYQRGDGVLDEIGVAFVRERRGETLDQSDCLVGRTQQQSARVRGDRPTVEGCHDPPPVDASEIQRIRCTVCRHRATSPHQFKSFSQNNFL